MSVTRADAITGEQLELTITFREENTGKVFDPFSIEQVDILRADGQTLIETIPGGSVEKIDLGKYKVTTQAINDAGPIQDKWLYRLKDGGAIKTSIEVTNVVAAPSYPAAIESANALPRDSAVILRPILMTFEFRDDQTGELFDPYEVRQVEILEEDGVTLIQVTEAINRIGIGKYRIQADAITTPRTILDKWYFTAAQGEEERTHTNDTQVSSQSALGITQEETNPVPEVLYADVSAHDAEVVLLNSVEKIGVTFKDENGVKVNPAQLSLDISVPGSSSSVLCDTYLPASARTPDPPRIINSEPGRFEFPFGLDNGSKDANKRNRTDRRCDLLFTWRASSIAGVKASSTINPGINPNSSVVWTAVADGTPGEFINISYVNPGVPDASLSIVRNGAVIVVNLATNAVSAIITTAADIVAEVANNEEVSEIVSAALPSGTGLGVVGPVAATFLTGGVDASEELVICQNVRVITHRVCALLQKLRLQIDKALKLVSSDPEHPCYLGYTEGQLVTFIEHGLQIINAYQPSGTFTIDNYPYGYYEFTLIEASLLAGVMSQTLFAVDTDVPNWSDQGNTFVIQHQPQLVQYLNWLSQRLDKMIPMLKLNFVSSGSLHIEAGPNFRLAQLIDAAPSGALFRNVFFKA